MKYSVSIKQIIGHITDHEHTMMYRSLRFSRRDKTVLPGYDQDLPVNNSCFDERTLDQLIDDSGNVRNVSKSFITPCRRNNYRLQEPHGNMNLP